MKKTKRGAVIGFPTLLNQTTVLAEMFHQLISCIMVLIYQFANKVLGLNFFFFLNH